MAFYKYDGKFLLDGGAFAISEDCCCGTACYLLRKCDADSNTCNTCDPSLPDDMYITISGSVDTDYNGTWKVSHTTGCTWEGTVTGFSTIKIDELISFWYVTGNFMTEAFIHPSGDPSPPCDPFGSYPQDPSGSATCIVSPTDPTSSTVGTNEIGVDDNLSTYSYGDVIGYNNICYYFLGEITCPTTPTTMGAWDDFTDCADCAAPSCTYPTGITGLQIQGYSDGDIPASSCSDCTDSTAEAAWDGKFPQGTGPWYDSDARGIGHIDTKAWGFESEVRLSGHPGPCYWEMRIQCEDTYIPRPWDIWIGRKDYGASPVGTYTRTSGCGTGGPSSLTVVEIP